MKLERLVGSPPWVPALHAILFAGAAASFWRPIDYLDVWWHLADGDAIRRLGAIPRADIFSWTARGSPWLNTEWLYDWTLSGLYARWGPAGVIALKAMFGSAILFLIWRRLRLFAAGWSLPLVFTGVVFAGAHGLWRDRSELVSVFLLAWLMLSMDRASSRERLPRSLWLWPPLFCLWANAHGMFAAGLVAAGLWTAASWLGWNGRRAAQRAAWLGACLLGTLVNPDGPKLVSTVFLGAARLGSSPLNEMRPTPWTESVFWGCLVLSALSFVARWKERREFAAPAAVVSAAFAWLGARHWRGAGVFMVVAFPYALANLERTRIAERARELPPRWRAPMLAVAIAASAVWAWSRFAAAHTGIDAAASIWIADAADFIVRENVRGPFYHDYRFGSYWAFRFRGDPGDFIDGRHGNVRDFPLIYDSIEAAKRSPELWRAFLESRGVRAAIVRYPDPSESMEPPLFSRYFPRDRWALVYFDDLCLIFLRRGGDNDRVIRRDEFRWARPDATLPYFAAVMRSRPELRTGTRADLLRALTLHPDSRRALDLLEVVDLAAIGAKGTAAGR